MEYVDILMLHFFDVNTPVTESFSTLLVFLLVGNPRSLFVFFFNDTATTEIYTLSLHDALPIWSASITPREALMNSLFGGAVRRRDRKSTRLNSSHHSISYAVFCLKKKKKY